MSILFVSKKGEKTNQILGAILGNIQDKHESRIASLTEFVCALLKSFWKIGMIFVCVFNTNQM